MRLQELAALPGVLRSRIIQPDYDLRALHWDSRQVDFHTGFVALPGTQTDGHRFLQAARGAGAPVLILTDSERFREQEQQPVAGLVGVLLVSGRRAVAELAAQVYGNPSHRLKLLGVTGTNGKATVTFLVAQILQALGMRCGILGSLGFLLGERCVPTERTTPEAPAIQAFLEQCVQAGVGSAAMEVSSIGIHQERTAGLRFAAAALTNLTQDHLDYHCTMAEYLAQKERLFLEYAPPWAVLNGDDAAASGLAQRLRRERPGTSVITFSLTGPAELTARGLRHEAEGSRGDLCVAGQREPFFLPLPGAFNVANLLAAVGLLLASGHRLADVAPAIATCRGAPGRFERVPLEAPFTVVVDYAHTPDALDNALRTARALTRARLAVLFGCGGDRDRGKRPQMGAIAARLADVTVLTSDNPRSEDPGQILEEIARGMPHGTPLRILERPEAVRRILDQARPGDFVLLAGKGSEPYQELGGRKLPMDDRGLVRDWARERGVAVREPAQP